MSVKEKPQRSMAILSESSGTVIIRITLGKDVSDYLVRRMESDFGSAFWIRKTACKGRPCKDQPYEVCLEGTVATCGCWASLKTPPCRHVAAIEKLLELGKL